MGRSDERKFDHPTQRPNRAVVSCRHTPSHQFEAGKTIELVTAVARKAASVKCHYRHVNQSEDYESMDMTSSGQGYQSVIPSSYSNTNYPLEYYFEVRLPGADPALYPGFNRELANQPYFVVRRG